MKPFQELLEKLRACSKAKKWAGDMTIEEVVDKCHRGDWLLWLAKKVNVDDRRLTLAKGLCANTVRHLMKDERSLKAVDAAIAYGRGEIDRDELDASYDAASAAYTYAAYAAADAAYTAAASAAYTYAAYAAADAAYTAADSDAAEAAADAAEAAAEAAADAAYTAAEAAAYAAYDAAYAADARKANQMQTANICREVIGQEIIERVNELLK